MLRKFLLVLLLLTLFGCSQQSNSEEIVVKDIYVDPVKDVFLFGELDANTQASIKKANGNKNYSNYQFSILNKDIYKQDLLDIFGNMVNLSSYDKLVLLTVSTECEHCHDLIASNLSGMLSHDIQLVQYFNVGNYDDILAFYDDLDMEIPDDLIIISRDEEMYDYVYNYLKLETYPTMLSYVNGQVSFCGAGEYDEDCLAAYYDLSFVNMLNNLIDKDGNDLLNLNRSSEDVKNSLNQENQEKISSLDNDGSTSIATYKIMGSLCDFAQISNDKSNIYVNEIDDFSIYEDKNLVLFYTYFRSEDETDKVEFINSLIDSNSDYEYIVVLVEGLESSSQAYKQMTTKFNCPCVSVLGYIPEDFYKVGLAAYPSAFFIRKGTFTGAYSNIESVDKFDIALKMFLSDECIALTRNN